MIAQPGPRWGLEGARALDSPKPELDRLHLASTPLAGADAFEERTSFWTGLTRSLPKLASPRFVGAVAREAVGLLAESARIAAGVSAVQPRDRDLRFADESWRKNP